MDLRAKKAVAEAAYNKPNGIGEDNANFIARNDKLKKMCEMYGV